METIVLLRNIADSIINQMRVNDSLYGYSKLEHLKGLKSGVIVLTSVSVDLLSEINVKILDVERSIAEQNDINNSEDLD